MDSPPWDSGDQQQREPARSCSYNSVVAHQGLSDSLVGLSSRMPQRLIEVVLEVGVAEVLKKRGSESGPLGCC